METPLPGEAEATRKPKRKPAVARAATRPARVAAPLVLEQVAAAPPPDPAAPAQPAPAAVFEPVIPVALALSLSFAPPPLAEPKVSPTTCLLERAFSDVHVAEPEDTALKPRLFERGVKLLASRIGQSPDAETH